ncbi:MAG: ABC-type transport auxiliary lipoprotein family protein [Nitrospiraceae bacterium]|uniref:ABC-type transport auxiliary lipoprotein family protein n=1 Tax=Nitrospira cf. moscoviensis SBR1015 TaxID=96242 RepID=UPI000B3BC312|nr:ABC-type transport auxiliary lipoprotein family protein [Nitrospira cf. moscoviensis SBR1015]MBY0246731.1 ABC-type transport auxiliary lipoprotein family protein [Nitrospiraceae bacterium]
MRGRIFGVLCAFLVLTAAGCLSSRSESQPAHTYRLSLDPERTEVRPADVNGPILMVSLPLAEPGFETPRMMYVKRPYELEHYALNQWADQPARMFASLMVQALGRTGSWRAVVPAPGSIRGDFRLDSYGFALQQEFMQNPSLVRVAVRAQVVEVKESRLVGARVFEVVEKAQSDDAYGGVVAANRAIAALLDDLALWLRECMRHSAECSR